MATKYENYITGDGTIVTGYANQQIAQTFTPSISHTITSVKVKIYKTGSPGNGSIAIKATDGSGHPTGSDLASGTYDWDTITDSSPGEWIEITLGDGAPLSSGIKYAIIMRVPVANEVDWRVDLTGSYAGGKVEYSLNAESSWSAFAAWDFMFEEWGELIVTDTDNSPFFGCNF